MIPDDGVEGYILEVDLEYPKYGGYLRNSMTFIMIIPWPLRN
jgi:hypothetical protein